MSIDIGPEIVRAPAAGPLPVIETTADAVAAARALAPGFAARALDTEHARSVPEESIAELIDSGLFGIVTPRLWGGSELGFGALLEVQIEIASACASTGWVYGVLAGHTWLAALFPEEAQAEIFENPRALVASLIRLGGAPPERVEGGFRWRGGTGRFCSGIDHSEWVLVGGQVTEDDGSAEPWYFLIPSSDVQIIDDWHAVGLKGTGSKSLLVEDAFIPSHRAIRFADLARGTSPGAELYESALYRLPYDSVWPLSLAGAPIGAARAAIASFTEATKRRIQPLPPIAQASNGPALVRLARAAAQLDSSTTLLLADAEAADSAQPGTTFDPLEKAKRHRNLAFAVQQARDAVNLLYEASGGSGVYQSGEIQRWWRDVNASSSHVAFTWDLASVGYGRAALGLSQSAQGAQASGPGVAKTTG